MLSSSSQACHLSSRKPQLSHDLKLVLLALSSLWCSAPMAGRITMSLLVCFVKIKYLNVLGAF